MVISDRVRDDDDDALNEGPRLPTLVVDCLPHPLTSDQLRELFLPYGRVRRAVVVRDEAGASLRFGYVDMESFTEAEAARQALNGTQFNGSHLRVAFFPDD